MAIFRIEVTPEVFRIVESEAFLRCTTIKAVASDILAEHCSNEAKELAGKRARIVIRPNDQMTINMCATKEADNQETIYQECSKPDHSESKPKRTPLRDDPAAQEKVKELIRTNPKMSYAAIAREVDKDREAVRKFIKSLEIGEEQSGELQVDEQPGI